MIKFLIEGVSLYFETLAEEIDRRHLQDLPRWKRWLGFASIVFLVSLIYPLAIFSVAGEEIKSRVCCPWRVEIFQNDRWSDMGGYKTIEQAVARLSLEARETKGSWRIRRGNEIFPGEILAS